MLKKVMGLLRPATPKLLPKWDNLIELIKNRQDYLVIRYLNTELADAPYVMLIEQILQSFEEEITTLLSIKDNFSRCVYLMEPRTRLFIEQRLDSIRAQAFFKRTFFYNYGTSDKTIELLIPVMEKDPLLNLPLMSYELYDWDRVKPIRIHYHNSLELVSNLVAEPRIKFKSDHPSIGIVTIDFISLIMKFINYLENQSITLGPGVLRTFLRDEIFIHFHEDVIELWLMNLITEVLECETEADVLALSDFYKTNSLSIVDFHNHLLFLFNELKEMKEGRVSPLQLLNSKLLFNRSILDRVRENLESFRTRDLRQYKHNQLAIDIVNLKLVLSFIQYSKNKPMVKTINYEIVRKLNLLFKNNFLAQFKSVTIKGWMQEILSDIKILVTET